MTTDPEPTLDLKDSTTPRTLSNFIIHSTPIIKTSPVQDHGLSIKPTDHLIILCNPTLHRPASGLLSPALHNVSDTYVRHLKMKLYEHTDLKMNLRIVKRKNEDGTISSMRVPKIKSWSTWSSWQQGVLYSASRAFIESIAKDEAARFSKLEADFNQKINADLRAKSDAVFKNAMAKSTLPCDEAQQKGFSNFISRAALSTSALAAKSMVAIEKECKLSCLTSEELINIQAKQTSNISVVASTLLEDVMQFTQSTPYTTPSIKLDNSSKLNTLLDVYQAPEQDEDPTTTQDLPKHEHSLKQDNTIDQLSICGPITIYSYQGESSQAPTSTHGLSLCTPVTVVSTDDHFQGTPTLVNEISSKTDAATLPRQQNLPVFQHLPPSTYEDASGATSPEKLSQESILVENSSSCAAVTTSGVESEELEGLGEEVDNSSTSGSTDSGNSTDQTSDYMTFESFPDPSLSDNIEAIETIGHSFEVMATTSSALVVSPTPTSSPLVDKPSPVVYVATPRVGYPSYMREYRHQYWTVDTWLMYAWSRHSAPHSLTRASNVCSWELVPIARYPSQIYTDLQAEINQAPLIVVTNEDGDNFTLSERLWPLEYQYEVDQEMILDMEYSLEQYQKNKERWSEFSARQQSERWWSEAAYREEAFQLIMTMGKYAEELASEYATISPYWLARSSKSRAHSYTTPMCQSIGLEALLEDEEDAYALIFGNKRKEIVSQNHPGDFDDSHMNLDDMEDDHEDSGFDVVYHRTEQARTPIVKWYEHPQEDSEEFYDDSTYEAFVNSKKKATTGPEDMSASSQEDSDDETSVASEVHEEDIGAEYIDTSSAESYSDSAFDLFDNSENVRRTIALLDESAADESLMQRARDDIGSFVIEDSFVEEIDSLNPENWEAGALRRTVSLPDLREEDGESDSYSNSEDAASDEFDEDDARHVSGTASEPGNLEHLRGLAASSAATSPDPYERPSSPYERPSCNCR